MLRPISLRAVLRPILLLSVVGLSTPAAAGERDPDARSWRDWLAHRYLHAGFGTHWSDSDDHEGTPWLVGLELSPDDRRIAGISLFNNSFGQFSQYYYYGYKWRLTRINEALEVKLSGGLIYGYVDEFEDRLDPNWNGWSPAIIPSVGWRQRGWGFDVAVLGTAGLMFLVGTDLGDGG